jgi:hypothetical protein
LSLQTIKGLIQVIVRTPEAEPTTVGEQGTVMVHDAAGATLALPALVCVNGPVSAMLVICSGPLPELFTVTFLALLEFPITYEENEIDAGVTAAVGPVPVRELGR